MCTTVTISVSSIARVVVTCHFRNWLVKLVKCYAYSFACVNNTIAVVVCNFVCHTYFVTAYNLIRFAICCNYTDNIVTMCNWCCIYTISICNCCPAFAFICRNLNLLNSTVRFRRKFNFSFFTCRFPIM